MNQSASAPSVTLPDHHAGEPPPARSASPRRVGLQRLLQAAVALALLTVLIWRASPAGLAGALRSANPALLALAVLLNLPIALLFTLRTGLVLKRLDHTVPLRTLLPIAVLGNVAGALTPAASGETVRVAMLRTHAGVGVGDGVALVFYERAMSLGLMLLGVAVVLVGLLLPLPAAAVAVAVAVLLLALPSVVARRLEPSTQSAAAAPAGPLGRLRHVLRGSGGRLCRLLAHAPLQLSWSALTAGIFALSTAQVCLAALSLSGSLNPLRAWLAFGGSQLAGIASMIPLGLGTADGSLAVVLGHAGGTLASGVLVAIIWRVTTSIPLLLAAAASYLYLLGTSHRAPS